MPTNALQHRSSIGTYQNSNNQNDTIRRYSVTGSRECRSTISDDITHLGRNISRIINTPDKPGSPSPLPNVTATLIMLLSNLRLPHVPFSGIDSTDTGTPNLSTGNAEIVGSIDKNLFTRNHGLPSVFSRLEEMLPYDPLRFPESDAASLPLAQNSQYAGELIRNPRHVLFNQEETTETPLKNDVVKTKLDYSCAIERQKLSFSDIVRNIGETFKNPITKLLTEFEILKYYKSHGYCPTEEQLTNIFKITQAFDYVISTIIGLLPETKYLSLTQGLGGSLLKLIADGLDKKDLTFNDLAEVQQSLDTLARVAITTHQEHNNNNINNIEFPEGLSTKKNKILIEVNGVNHELVYKNDRAFVVKDGKYLEVKYSSQDKTWSRVIKGTNPKKGSGRTKAVMKCHIIVKRNDVEPQENPNTQKSSKFDESIMEKYKFPKYGLFNEIHFKQDWNANRVIPEWAKGFLIESDFSVSPEDISSRIGAPLSSGINGQVSVDRLNPNYVIKSIKASDRTDDFAMKLFEGETKREVDAFRKCYGKSSAKYYINRETGYAYIRMRRIPGVQLSQIKNKSLPRNAIQLFDDMMNSLSKRKIILSDLSEANILWDEQSKRFFPIDIETPANPKMKESFMQKQEKRTPGIKEFIEKKKIQCQ